LEGEIMKKFEVTYRDEFEANTEEEAYDKFLTYLEDCVIDRDITVFQFYELPEVSDE
jgi:hypothetical protein